MHLPVDDFLEFKNVDTSLKSKLDEILNTMDKTSNYYFDKSISKLVSDREGAGYLFFYRNKQGDLEIMAELNTVHKTDYLKTKEYSDKSIEDVREYISSCEKTVEYPPKANRFTYVSDITSFENILSGVKLLQPANELGGGRIFAARLI